MGISRYVPDEFREFAESSTRSADLADRRTGRCDDLAPATSPRRGRGNDPPSDPFRIQGQEEFDVLHLRRAPPQRSDGTPDP